MPADLLPMPARLGARPLYALLAQFPAVCFTGALVTDVVYAQTAQFLWVTFSVWLLAVGCVMAGLAGLVGLAYFIGDRRLRAAPLAWPHALASLLAAALSLVNTFVHSRDGYTAVVPEGLALSAIVVVLMGVATVLGWARPARVVVRPGVSA